MKEYRICESSLTKAVMQGLQRTSEENPPRLTYFSSAVGKWVHDLDSEWRGPDPQDIQPVETPASNRNAKLGMARCRIRSACCKSFGMLGLGGSLVPGTF